MLVLAWLFVYYVISIGKIVRFCLCEWVLTKMAFIDKTEWISKNRGKKP